MSESVYWSVEECRWLSCPVRDDPPDDAVAQLPEQREAPERTPVAQT